MKDNDRDQDVKNEQNFPSSEPERDVEAPKPGEPESSEVKEKGTPETRAPVEEKKPPEEKKPEEKRPSFWRRALRWTLGFVILIVAGFLLAVFTLYQPAQDDLRQARNELETANERILELENMLDQREQRIQELQALEDRNETLQQELQDANLHVSILQARLNVANALRALAQDDQAQAELALTTTSETLDRIAEMLPPSQSEVVESMRQRLDLALSEIETGDTFAAQSDLEVLASSLVELENNLFPAQ